MDKTDLEILKILREKVRIPNIEVSRTIDMDPSAVFERIKKLEAKKIIQGYEVPEVRNVWLRHDRLCQHPGDPPIQNQGSRRTGAAIEQVQEVHYLAGGDTLMIKIKASDNMELEELIQTRIAYISSVKATRKFIALSTFKESAKIKLPDNI